MNKNTHYLLICVLSLVLLGKANPAYSWISSNTFYYKVAYCVNETGKGTVYAKGPKVSNNSNSEVEFTRTDQDQTRPTNVIMSKIVFDWFVAPDNVDMYYSLYAENSHEDYQFDHWEKKNGNSWDIIKDENQNPIISPIYDAPKVNVTNPSTNPPVSATYRAYFSRKGVLKVEIAEGQENLGHVTNSNVNNKAGDVVTLSAQSTQSFQGVFFSHWTIDGNSTYQSKENPLTVEVPDGVTSIVYRAHFTVPSELTYCRFENVESGKFLSLSSTNGATRRQESADGGGYRYKALEINALKLLSNTSSSMGDPSTVFYIGGTSDNAEGISPITVLQSQGENVLPNFAYGNDNRPVKITKAGQYFRISKIMTVNSKDETGEVFLNDEGTDTPVFSNAQGNNALWKIHFLDEGHINEHAFGVAPDARMLHKNGKYYTTLYTKFPYKMLDGIKAYYLDITKPDQIYNEQTRKITFLEVPENEKIIPKNMAVILECSGTNPERNRLLPIVDKENSIREGKYVTDKNNPLKGALVVGGGLTGAQAADKYNLRQDYVYVYSAKNGLVSFFKRSGNNVIPNNKVYLAVTKDFEGETSSDGNAAKGYTFIYGNDFEEGSIATNIDHPEQTEEDGIIYSLQGVKVTNPSTGVYIKNGKKYIVK